MKRTLSSVVVVVDVVVIVIVVVMVTELHPELKWGLFPRYLGDVYEAKVLNDMEWPKLDDLIKHSLTHPVRQEHQERGRSSLG